jgi:hypothetical protein
MQQEWPDLTAEEVRATAKERLELHYEHEDALTVERGKWRLSEHLCRYSVLQIVIGGLTVKGDLLAVGTDWAQLSSGLFRITACEQVRPLGRGNGLHPSPLTFRQCLRQYAGRIPREIVTQEGESMVVGLDWVAADFVHARVAGRPALVPLSQIAAVLGTV